MKALTMTVVAVATLALTACAKEEPVMEKVMEEPAMEGKL